MADAGVPTGTASDVLTAAELDAALDACGAPYVVKADGLAAGKGVLVTSDRDAARDHALTWLEQGPVLVEEFLAGPRGLALLHQRRRPRGAALPRPGLQAPRGRRRRAEHRRHGRVLAAALARRRASATRRLRRAGARHASPSPCWTGSRPRARRSSGCSTAGSSSTAPRHPGDRVQRPLRRPRDAGRAAPARDPALRAAARRGHAARSTPCRAPLLAGCGGPRRARQRGLPRAPAPAAPSRGVDDADALPGVTVVHAATARDRRTACWPPAAACSPSSAPAPTVRRGPGPRLRGRRAHPARGSAVPPDIAARSTDDPPAPASPRLAHVPGKVRDLYVPRADRLATTCCCSSSQRPVSAFDQVLEPGIPGKGALLTALSRWWFARLPDVPNHLVDRRRAVARARGGAPTARCS